MEPLAWIAEHRAGFADWLTAQRWYGDKSRALASVEFEAISMVDADGVPVWLIAVSCRFDGGGNAQYFVPLVAERNRAPQDAMESQAFRRWLAQGFAEKRSLAATARPGARLCWEPIPGSVAADWTSDHGKLLAGEQSNTSVIYAGSAILKVFRRLQPGINPDSEIVAFLTSRTAYHHVPEFLGSFLLRLEDGGPPVELGAVQAFVENEGDCWRWLPRALETSTPGDLETLLEPIALLGRRTGELHAALAGSTELDAFRPEPFTIDDVEAEVSRLAAELASTFTMIRRQDAMTDQECDDLETALRDRLPGVDVLEGLPRIRVHGDYHLGQVLRVGGDFVIIDFEGEPSRPMSERRKKHSPLKDVAGMLRSLDYAASSARFTMAGKADSALRSWSVTAERAFLDGYRESVVGAPIQLVPRDDARFQAALDLFMIDKALYEARYELDNRPDWLGIPLDGLRRVGART